MIASHPFELFCQHRIDLKCPSPARETAWFGLTGGYLSTLPAAMDGGYSGFPFSWARFAPEVGHRVVDAVAKPLHDREIILPRPFERY